MNTKYNFFFSAVLIVLVTIMTFFGVFSSADSFITDLLYNRNLITTDKIVIIGVDEETLSEYGNFNTWSREKTGELIDFLYSDPSCEPSVVGVDFLFVDPFDEKVDEKLVSSVMGHENIVFATNLVYRGALKETTDSKLYYDPSNIEYIEMPFDDLMLTSNNGYTNALISKDGFVRLSSNTCLYEGETVNSFAYEIYKEYCEKNGLIINNPKTNSSSQYQFFFSGKTGQFSHVSLRSVLNGDVPQSVFKDAIVLVGAYAPGFQDAYQVAVDRGNPMYGVEIHANVIQALMQNKTATSVPIIIVCLVTFLLAIAFMYLGSKNKLSLTLIISLGLAIVVVLSGCILAKIGYVIPLIYILVFLILTDVYFVIQKYVLERIRRKKTISVFKQYVAPQVVEKFMQGGEDFEIKLGGEKREVAVLFVDIRGFTPLSESLGPEQVVEILNEYLTHTTSCIFKHGGTLDKFIGDATMAVFNAPFSQEDYIYEAVATAYDIAKGSEELGSRLEKAYGKKVSFGVGVNCGEAVVGNIGCDFRMDYTAIGDTVNTAARLESNAGPGQILISRAVYDALEGRIEAESIGEIPLKGKSTKIEVFSVSKLL